MRDTRPNNKRTLQSGQGLYGTRQTATRPQPDTARSPAPAPLACRRPSFPSPMFLGAGAVSGKPSSVLAVDPGHLTGALVRHRIRKGDRALGDPRRARLPCHHPALPRWAPTLGVSHGAGPAARAPQSWALRPGSRPGCPPAGQTSFYFWFLAGASPRRAGQLLPAGRGCRAPRRPSRRRDTAGEGDTRGGVGWRATGN